jgi:hypothetical protein
MQTNKLLTGFVGIFAIVFTIFVMFSASSIWEQVDAGEIVVCQDPIDGDMHVYPTPGLVSQNFGDCEHYDKSTQLWFTNDAAVDKDIAADDSMAPFSIRFNDGGKATLNGSIRFNLPLAEDKILDLHSRFGSQNAIERDLVRTVVGKAVYNTGPLMSSKESYSDRRNDLIDLISDQASAGVYKTKSFETKIKDELTGEDRTITKVEPLETEGVIQRQEESPIISYGVTLQNLAITKIAYDKTIDQQIQAQQKAIMDVQTAIANSKKAEQDARTVEEQGKAAAAQAKWEQETLNAKEIAEAEKALQVAQLKAKEAQAYKQEQILRGQGEAERKRLQMTADGALNPKLDTYKEVMFRWAEAFEKHSQPLVPSVVMGEGGASNANGSGVNTFMELLSAKAAKDLSLDLTVKQGRKASK